jgi:GNAT superfamily N-acetyltransferase
MVRMVGSLRPLRDRGEVLEAAHYHPYARFIAGTSRQLRGVAVEGAVVWQCVGPFGPVAHAVGEPLAVEVALAGAHDAGILNGIRWMNLPRDAAMPPGYALREAWDYRWLPSRAALVTSGAGLVRPITDADELNALLDVAYPDSELRPGNPVVTQWYGLYTDRRLVASAADRTHASPEPDAVPTGVIGAVAVHPDHRGRGLGAAVTAGVAAVLLARHNQVGLGVAQDNDVAARVYDRIGFTGRHPIASVRPA